MAKAKIDVNKYLPTDSAFSSDFFKAITTLDQSAVNIAKNFGQGRENIVNIKATLTDASDSLTKVGVSITESLGRAKEIQNAYTNVMGTGALLTKETFGKLEAINKVTGVDIDGVIKGFADVDMSPYDDSD